MNKSNDVNNIANPAYINVYISGKLIFIKTTKMLDNKLTTRPKKTPTPKKITFSLNVKKPILFCSSFGSNFSGSPLFFLTIENFKYFLFIKLLESYLKNRIVKNFDGPVV